MKVLKVVEPGKFEFEERPIPEAKKNEVLLKMKYCGICGSDVKVFTGSHPYASYPRIPGHEISAEIMAYGNTPTKTPLKVSINPYFTCGVCEPCKSGMTNCCQHNQTLGVQRDGAYAEYIVVPVEKIVLNYFPLDSKLLALTEPFGVATHAVDRIGVRVNDNVLIFGAGPIGIFCGVSLLELCRSVYIVDHHKEKLKIVIDLGIHPLYAIPKNKFDVCIDASGSKEVIADCFKYVKVGGKVVFIGHSNEDIPMPHSDIIKKELTIIASRNSIDLSKAQSKIHYNPKVKNTITHIVPFKEVPEFYKEILSKNGKIVKALIEF
jgi:2-desacetyl-2-hydroxyethyl bacteriochlorophyllide A dehydrogenase